MIKVMPMLCLCSVEFVFYVLSTAQGHYRMKIERDRDRKTDRQTDRQKETHTHSD